MDKRYQVFVSSTYADLKEERQHVIQTLMEMDCIPAGMELFPAADEEQWEFIKKVIDDCDYYLLVIGGRYGSMTSEGISYTEQEFDYAVSKGIKVVALLHEAPEEIPSGKTDKDPELKQRLEEFKEKVKEGRLVKFWNTAKDLPGLVSLSLNKTIKMYPAVGWIRADRVANEEILSEINNLRKDNHELQAKLEKNGGIEGCMFKDIAPIDSPFSFDVIYRAKKDGYRVEKVLNVNLPWKTIFIVISMLLMREAEQREIDSFLGRLLLEMEDLYHDVSNVRVKELETIGLQLKAYGLINIKPLIYDNTHDSFSWSLTPKGEQYMLESRVVREKRRESQK